MPWYDIVGPLVISGLIWIGLRWLVRNGKGDKESRQYRREMYRQQQASWHAQEEAPPEPPDIVRNQYGWYRRMTADEIKALGVAK